MSIRPYLIYLLCVGAGLALTSCGPGRVLASSSFRREGARLIVSAAGDFQAALDAAQPGETIVLESGKTYRGHFVLPPKTRAGFITIQSSEIDRLPGEGTRVTQDHAQWMAKVVCSSCPAIEAPAGSHNYKLIGIEVHPAAGVYANDLITLGDGAVKTLAAQAHDFELDRLIIHGDPAKGAKRGITLNARAVTVTNSQIYDIKGVGQDTQAIGGWAGPGPFRIVNNYLEAAGENLLLGGAAPLIPNMVPSDIEIARNHFFKPLSWQDDKWLVKNLFELKNARHVRIHGNIFENNWPNGQNGFGVVFSVRTCEAGNYPWSVIEDVEFSHNILRGSTHGISLLGIDDMRTNCGGGVGGKADNIRIHDNLIDSVERAFMVLRSVSNLAIEHNTVLNTGNIMMAEGEPNPGLVFRDNVAMHNAYGVIGAGKGIGSLALRAFFPKAEFKGNVLVGTPKDRYPSGNFYPDQVDQVGFVNMEAKQYRLDARSPYHNRGADGRDPGADFTALDLEVSGVIEGKPKPLK